MSSQFNSLAIIWEKKNNQLYFLYIFYIIFPRRAVLSDSPCISHGILKLWTINSAVSIYFDYRLLQKYKFYIENTTNVLLVY